MYCGNCFRDNALVAEFRRQGQEVLMIPLYLPMTLDEEDQSSGIPVFFGGINVYLEQKLPLLGRMPEWLHRWLASPALLKWAAGRAAKTRAAELGGLTLSMLRGEEGNQARELRELVQYLKRDSHPHVVSLSNALLVGLAREIKRELNTSVVCMLQGEDYFLDSLPDSHRQQTWDTLAERCRDIDLFIAPSRYFGELMTRRLRLPPEKVRVIYNGIHLAGWETAAVPPDPPVLGFFARMCREKGLHLVVEAFIALRQRGRLPHLKLHVGGAMGPGDQPFVEELKQRLQGQGLLGDTTFFCNITREQKQQFFRRISVCTIPALYGEAFGLYLIESWAAGVPVVQPPAASFPELIEQTAGGIVARAADATALADALEEILLNETARARAGAAGRAAVEQRFTAPVMAAEILNAFSSVARLKQIPETAASPA